MEPLLLDEMLKASKGVLYETPNSGVVDRHVSFNGVSVDTRTINKGELFFALRGPSYDGHKFITEAIRKGAGAAVAEHKYRDENAGLLIHVSDAITAMGDLAKYYREKMPARIVAVTGSNGKTSTKDMIYHLLSKKYKVVRSQKSFNNFIGVPLTVFDINREHEFGVLEMGTNAFGEIRRLSEIGGPDIAVITNISETHLQGLKSISGVQKAKAEILENIKDGGLLLINSDDPLSLEIAKGFKGEYIDYGLNKNAKINASEIKRETQGYSFVLNGKYKVRLPVDGNYNIFNALAAFAVTFALDLEPGDYCDAFDDFKLSPMRMDREEITLSDSVKSNMKSAQNEQAVITVINDAYNANPSSMRAAIQDFGQSTTAGRKVFVCGDMSELGDESERAHIEIGQEIGIAGVDLLLAVGDMAKHVLTGAVNGGMAKENILLFKDVDNLMERIVSVICNNDTILIKGSRSMQLERVVKVIKS